MHMDLDRSSLRLLCVHQLPKPAIVNFLTVGDDDNTTWLEFRVGADSPAMISENLIGSPVIRCITFTGSTAVGKQLATLAIQGMKRMTLELGGHAPVVIFDDIDPEAAAISAIVAKYRNAGQVCTSPTRFFVHEAIYNKFAVRFSELASAIHVGDGFDAATKMGPLANARRVDSIQRFVEDAKARNIAVSAGGEACGNRGFFYRPTVLAGVHFEGGNRSQPLARTAAIGRRGSARRR